MRSVSSLARGSLEAGSVKTYTPGLNKFKAFVKDTCAELGHPPWPHETTRELRDLVSSKGVVEAFIVYAHQQGLQSGTIDVHFGPEVFWDGRIRKADFTRRACSEAAVKRMREDSRTSEGWEIGHRDCATQEVGGFPESTRIMERLQGRFMEGDGVLCFLRSVKGIGVPKDGG